MEQHLTCAIIDDDNNAAEVISSYIAEDENLELIGIFHSAVEAIKTLCEFPVDILFLEAQMPEMSGIEFAKILPKTTRVVFTTSSTEYAIDSFQVNTSDYLLKPITKELFKKAVDKVQKYYIPSEYAHQFTFRDGYIFVKSDYKLVRVNTDDILYVYGLKDYVNICMADGRKIPTLLNLTKLQERFPYPEFMRVHRSYIVHVSKADRIERMHFVFGDQKIPVSDTFKEDVNRILENHTI